MFIDTHCHLNFKQFDKDKQSVISRAQEAGIDYIINVGSDPEASRQSAVLTQQYEFIYASVGVHPHDAKGCLEKDVAELKALALANNKVVAVGEVGLDYYRSFSPREAQQKVFKEFIDLAEELNLPLIIHDRDAHDDVLGILRGKSSPDNNPGAKPKGVIHCFSGDETLAKEFLKLGFLISFTGNITYKNAEGLKKAVAAVPIEKMLLETDAPYLAPQDFRGKRNEPAHVRYVAEEIARIKGLSLADVARITSLQAQQLFALGQVENKGEIAYQIRDSLYLNITNQCTNNCNFCVRSFTDYVKGYNLRLEHEPSAEEIIKAVGNPGKYKEVVFCGYGEPLLRLDIILAVAKALKTKGAYIRINTNGHGNLIHGRSVANDLAGLVDEVSVSLDVDTAEKYNRICRPKFGPRTFEKIIEFIRECKNILPRVSVTCINLPEVDIEQCRKIAGELGAGFRVRQYNEVG